MIERNVSRWADWSDSELIDQAACGSMHPALLDDEIVRESIAMNVIKPFRQRVATLTSQRNKLVKALKLFECIDFDHFTEHDELLLKTVRKDVRALLAELSQTKEGV